MCLVVRPGDHPRVCGEKIVRFPVLSPVKGSPPRMRGKENAKKDSSPTFGITPAYAGKSHIIDSFMQLVKDHPRVCGEKLFLNPS